MANDLQIYLASKYMSGPKADAILATKDQGSKKKSKKKQKAHEDRNHSTNDHFGLILRDADDESSWKLGNEEDELQPVLENVATFKGKASSESKWAVVKPSESELQKQDESKVEPEDEQPQIVETDGNRIPTGGLQTSAEIKAQLHLKKLTTNLRAPSDELEEETIYRDSRGQKLDTKQLRAEEKRRRARELEKKMKKMEWGKGLVQREEKKADADELSKIASQPFARTIDDKDLNDELKERQRWNDPAAAFLTKSSKSSTSSRPKYSGPPPPPNRYGINPGYRWDGVDRSNGFEAKLFQTGNDQKRARAEAYSYSVDEM